MVATGGGSGLSEPSMPSGWGPTSSTAPSQSLSRPSHTSASGPTPPTQVRPPAPSHSSWPGWHGGFDRSPGNWFMSYGGVHGPPSGIPLSIVPSQSLSRPSQTSGAGGTSPAQSS